MKCFFKNNNNENNYLLQYINFDRVLNIYNNYKFIKFEHNYEYSNILYIKNL